MWGEIQLQPTYLVDLGALKSNRIENSVSVSVSECVSVHARVAEQSYHPSSPLRVVGRASGIDDAEVCDGDGAQRDGDNGMALFISVNLARLAQLLLLVPLRP